MDLLLATANRGKAGEFAALLGAVGAGWRLLTLADLGIAATARETGATFRENARIKALHYSRLAGGRLTLADDSGLEVAALGGAPGVRSARYAGEGAPDRAHVDKLLAALAGETDRRAAFTVWLHLARAGETVAEFHGRAAGTILDRPRGEGGFGYDPVFYYPPLGKSFAELEASEKNRVSHRARAVSRLSDFLAGYHP